MGILVVVTLYRRPGPPDDRQRPHRDGGVLVDRQSTVPSIPTFGLVCRVGHGVFPEAIEIHTRKFYTTDSAAFDHVAARALLHGSDPYAISMSPAAHLLKVPALFWTYTVNGGHVSQFSYPAGSFLFDVPAMALGLHHAVVDWMDLLAWLVSGVLLFALLPASLRWLSALVVLTPALLGSFSSGETDAMFVPFLILAVWRWDRFGGTVRPDWPAGSAR